jgi:hypothetical protein
MPIIEYLNAAAFKMDKRKKVKDRLEASANLATRDNNGEGYKVALINEIVHLLI